MPKSRGRASKKDKRSASTRPRLSTRGLLERAISNRDRIFGQVHQGIVEVLPEECRQVGTSDGIEAQRLLLNAHKSVQEVGVSCANDLGTYSWLYHLRRLPDDLLSGRLKTTAPYCMQIAENLSFLTKSDEYFPERDGQQVVPPLTRQGAESVIKLIAISTALAQIHSVLRRAGKGQVVRWASGDLPWVVSNPVLDDAIELYDQRVDAGGGLWAGTAPSTFHPMFTTLPEAHLVDDFFLTAIQLPGLTSVPHWDGPAQSIRSGSLRPGRYLLGGETMGGIAKIFARANISTSWVPAGLPSLLLLLRMLFRITLFTDFPVGKALPAVGYVLFPTSSIVNLLMEEKSRMAEGGAQAGPFGLPSSAEVAVAELRQLTPSVWPLTPGPVLRAAGDQTVVDIAAASRWLYRLLTIENLAPPQLVNARAGHFEEIVQAAVDSSPWAPPSTLRKLRGKTLRVAGNAVTDIDAIASCGATVILISCKSIPHTAELDAGLYGRVRNVRTHLEASDKEWKERLDILRATPLGDNFDFSNRRLLGVVCTPHVEFTYRNEARVLLGAANSYALRAVCSLSEMVAFFENAISGPDL